MELLLVSILAVFSIISGVTNAQDLYYLARWCVVNELEHRKCVDLTNAITQHILLGRNTTVGAYSYKYTDLPNLECVQGVDQYDCMQQIFNNQADLIQLETGLSYTAGQYYNMMPLVAEKYQPGENDFGLKYYAVAVARKSNPSVNFKTLKGSKACLPGVGRAAGWINPISTLIQSGVMDIVECNVPVKSADAFFSQMCAPDALARYYNPFGNNPTTVCKLCAGKQLDNYCTCNDPYADYGGAFACMADGVGDVTFVRNTTVFEYVANVNTTDTEEDFELLCTDGTRAPVSASATCNWGIVSSHIVMTSLVRSPTLRSQYKTLLLMLSADFGQNGVSNDLFRLFDSMSYGRQNLMFTDETVMLKDTSKVEGGKRDSYYSWAGKDLHDRLVILNSCPVQQARWCVISYNEMIKCENMIMAFSAKNIKPDLNCVRGLNVQDCMQKINTGDADLITLDAADVYQAGMDYGLVPIASEDYSGDNSGHYFAVAVARRANLYLTLFNMKQRRTCHSAVMSAAGWVIPVDKLVETGQIRITGCDAYLAVSQYFSKSCVPGVLSDYYNPYKTNPVNLCEACQTSGPKRCLRNDDELYYGASGAFRCVTEKGGDVGFIRHTTVRENTDGRNQADWARNRRSDDYELLCNDGTRKDIDDWADCYLASIPNNAIVTAGFKSAKERDIFWTLLNFAQQFFDADSNPDFPMFDSFINHKDLIFQDATVRLMSIDAGNQTYVNYLGKDFIRRMQGMKNIDCVTGRAPSFQLSVISMLALIIVTLWTAVN